MFPAGNVRETGTLFNKAILTSSAGYDVLLAVDSAVKAASTDTEQTASATQRCEQNYS